MARIDDYIAARKIVAEMLAGQNFKEISERAQFETEDRTYIIPFLTRTYKVSYPDFSFTDMSDESLEVPIQEQVLILHYMNGESEKFESDNWVAYREIPGATFYMGAFIQRAVNPLKNVFGNDVETLKKAAAALNATTVEAGDAAFEFRPFPRVALRTIIWEGDSEFPAEAGILFHKTVNGILSPEDIAWLAGMVVYRLMALSR